MDLQYEGNHSFVERKHASSFTATFLWKSMQVSCRSIVVSYIHVHPKIQKQPAENVDLIPEGTRGVGPFQMTRRSHSWSSLLVVCANCELQQSSVERVLLLVLAKCPRHCRDGLRILQMGTSLFASMSLNLSRSLRSLNTQATLRSSRISRAAIPNTAVKMRSR